MSTKRKARSLAKQKKARDTDIKKRDKMLVRLKADCDTMKKQGATLDALIERCFDGGAGAKQIAQLLGVDVSETRRVYRARGKVFARDGLKRRLGLRSSYRGTFSRYGRFSYNTVLLTDIQDAETDKPMACHLWINADEFVAFGTLAEGDVVEFDAVSREYERGYQGDFYGVVFPLGLSYGLAGLLNIVKVAQ